MNTAAEKLRKEGYERGVFEGEQRGEQKGMIKTSQDMLIEALQERFGPVHPALVNKVRSIQSTETLKGLFRQVFKLHSLEAFTKEVEKALK